MLFTCLMNFKAFILINEKTKTKGINQKRLKGNNISQQWIKKDCISGKENKVWCYRKLNQ